MNYFALFNLPACFAIDEAALEKAYFDAQRQFHPDRFAGKPDAERQQAMQQSVNVNEAYQTLKSPLKRAQALLAHEGIRVNTEQDTIKPSHALLTEIMELREQLAEANNADAVREMQDWIQQAITNLTTALAAAFTNEEFTKAAEMTLRLNYLIKLADDIRLQLTKFTRPAA